MRAKALNDKQRHYDELHHRMRVVWLSHQSPVWADGEPVAKHEALSMLNSSKRALELIVEGCSVRSVDLQDAAYLSELDAFGARLN